MLVGESVAGGDCSGLDVKSTPWPNIRSSSGDAETGTEDDDFLEVSAKDTPRGVELLGRGPEGTR